MYRMSMGWPRGELNDRRGPTFTHSVYVALCGSRALDVASDQQSGGHRDHHGHVACKTARPAPGESVLAWWPIGMSASQALLGR